MKDKNAIIRTAAIGTHIGRTLEGLALRWDAPELVGDEYLEEFAPESVDRTLRERPSHALGILHPWSAPTDDSPIGRTSPVPIGAVTFARTAEGLAFTARISRTAAGDDALELLNDGALGPDVSIGAKGIRHIVRASQRGPVLRRLEIALRELSLSPPGMSARSDSRIEVMRAAATPAATPALDDMQRRLRMLRL